MKLLPQLLVLLHASMGASEWDVFGQSEGVAENGADPTYQPTTVQGPNAGDDATYQPTTDTYIPTIMPTPVPTIADENNLLAAEGDPTYEPTAADTYMPTAEPTMYPTYLPTILPTATKVTSLELDNNLPTVYVGLADEVTNISKDSDVDTETTALYASAVSQSQPKVSSEPNGRGIAIAAGIFLPMLILVAYGFGVYRRNRIDEREDITEQADQEQNDSSGQLEDVELV
ncbi:hypothetical protein QTG54_011113 [Skeletonema marinoi]|uniref:Uncharacterized protein n=1 Tax=Skeletonema marinoi TaxID=267567 RepID=A0AAD8Y2I7_9STRA|nr:hypothetical protein QTG54_011113 [Skeletonema marinoi]